MKPTMLFVTLLVFATTVRSGQAEFDPKYKGAWLLKECIGGVLDEKPKPFEVISMITYNSNNVSTLHWYQVTGDGVMIGFISIGTSPQFRPITKCDTIQKSTGDAKFYQDVWINACDAPNEYELRDNGKEFVAKFVNEKGSPTCTYQKIFTYLALTGDVVDKLKKLLLTQAVQNLTAVGSH